MDFNKLTLKSQEAVAAAQELARRMGNPELYPEHLLLALLDQELPQQLVPDSAELRAQAEAALRAKPSVQGMQQQPNVSAAFSRVLDKAAETFGCCCIPWTDGFARSAASACARNSAASGTSCCGSSWSSSASSRCSG